LNGIDHDVWNPQTDTYLTAHLPAKVELKLADIEVFKQNQKKNLVSQLGLNQNIPWITFIGRLVREKGADILPDLINETLEKGTGLGFIILGSGELYLHELLRKMSYKYPGKLHVHIGYDETLAHQLYAASDFILMPSRVEPCGLNQLYALRYGTIPMVRDTGGLHDTVVDMGDTGGFGIKFLHASETDIVYSIERAIEVYKNKKKMNAMIQIAMQLDHSWESVIAAYKKVYQSIA
jgi:starch synthase